MAVNETNMRAFIATLRSGEFKQATGALRKYVLDKDGLATDELAGYCCLGVATEMAIRDGVIFKSSCQSTKCGNLHTVWNEHAFLAKEIQEWLGVSEENPFLGGDVASTWNDTVGYTFAQIADLFEDEFLPEDAAKRVLAVAA